MKFIYFGNDWFADNRTSSHHIARRLGARFPLLYVEVPGLRPPKANSRDLLKLVKKICLTFQRPQLVAPHLWRMTLPQVPFRRFRAVRASNRALSTLLIRRAIRRLGFDGAIAWFHVPHPGFLAKKLGESLTVFYCIDEYSKLPGVDENAVQEMDDTLTKDADVVFVCSAGLLDTHRRLNPKVCLSAHGVDTETFALAASPDTPIPDTTGTWKRPIVGFWGLLDTWVDLSLLTFIARARPDWTLLLIGRVVVDCTDLRQFSNVVLLGVKPYSELPQWAKVIDVCILPFTLTSLMLLSSPLKLREYLATGKPIVAVPLPDVLQYGGLVKTATDGPGFVAAIEEALANDTPELAAMRRRAVEGITWDATVTKVLAKLEEELMTRNQDPISAVSGTRSK